MREFAVELPFGPPPILFDVQQQIRQFIVDQEDLPINSFEISQDHWLRNADPAGLLHFNVAQVPTTMRMSRDPTSGLLLGATEVSYDGKEMFGNEIAITTIPKLLEEMDDFDLVLTNDLLTTPPSFDRGFDFTKEANERVKCETLVDKKEQIHDNAVTHIVDLAELLRDQKSFINLLDEEPAALVRSKTPPSEAVEGEASIDLEVLTKDIVVRAPVLRISELTGPRAVTSTEWAEVVDVSNPVSDFHQRIPNMAFKYDFELDNFQKQAILKLEERCNVLVSAHTSAGKTVVAEYAIALSQRHMTRVIYASPIKALSNQKYREFRRTFRDVGLITGDFQVNPTGTCLVMTTEILRSMLLSQNDVIRDLEYAIFDEVHYINDMDPATVADILSAVASLDGNCSLLLSFTVTVNMLKRRGSEPWPFSRKRGHVWEEVLILLPPHVSIVMLSATVPNALQFADWVGRTKQRRMYVVTTLFRPVPLKHYLYTGSGGSSKDERFLILDKESFKKQGVLAPTSIGSVKDVIKLLGNSGCEMARPVAPFGRPVKNELMDFLRYIAAIQAKEKRSKRKDGPRDGLKRRLGTKQESTLWVALMEHLLSRDELPAIAFTLSRKRCDQNADALALDLTTNKEKGHIKMFFQRSVQRLNQSDRELPQVLQLQRLLERGIGVHHSGILPILKEIVELLFQERFVKVLFATETFAMGVNMPAKTVVFDSILKFDGLSERTLLPSEYIQMAGRAGRRGLDENGNVLLICKEDVPSEHDLVSMMTGQPRRVESQFRLTYSIILKLERKRVTAQCRVTVEEMMANSFMESEHIKKKGSHEEALKKVEQALQDAKVSTDQSPAWEKLKNISQLGLEFIDIWHEIGPKVLSSKNVVKFMTPGRVLFVTHGTHRNKLGLLLFIEYKKDIRLKVLVLDEAEPKKSDGTSHFHKILALTDTRVYVPSTIGGHAVLTISPDDVLDVTTVNIKVDAKVVLNDWDNRQIPRFKDNPPGQSFRRALEDLVAATHDVQMSNNLETVPILKDMTITTGQELNAIKRLSEIRKTLRSVTRDEILDWEQQLEEVYRITSLEKQKENLAYLLSYQSMSLYTEYQNRLHVLRKLGYVDGRNSVQMKGNVACEMSSHELIITELVLRNILNDLQPPEIAALLSCFVYQGKDTGEALSISETLAKAIQTIKDVEADVTLIERQCEVREVDPFGPEKGLNFSLVPVVYEWALDKPFSQIMTLTDIQEGIIVRCIQQLNEIIRDVRDAARLIGEPTLQQKMEEASNAIKRDIVFAASLYMQ